MEKRGNFKKQRDFKILLLLAFFLSLAGILSAQHARLMLVVNGKNTGASIVQLDGHSYVDIETLAQITHGSLKLEPNRIVLTLPESNPTIMATQTAPGISRDFAAVAIIALGYIKEWKANLETMVTYGLAVNPAWAQDYSDRVKASLAEAAAAATTSADRNTLPLLNHQFASLTKWASDLAAERGNLNGARTIDPDSLHNDPALTKISNCDKVLNSMLVRGNPADAPGCQ